MALVFRKLAQAVKVGINFIVHFKNFQQIYLPKYLIYPH